MDAACTIQDSIHVFSLVHKYVSRILGTYQSVTGVYVLKFIAMYSILRWIMNNKVRIYERY